MHKQGRETTGPHLPASSDFGDHFATCPDGPFPRHSPPEFKLQISRPFTQHRFELSVRMFLTTRFLGRPRETRVSDLCASEEELADDRVADEGDGTGGR